MTKQRIEETEKAQEIAVTPEMIEAGVYAAMWTELNT